MADSAASDHPIRREPGTYSLVRRRVQIRAVGVLPDRRDVITEGDARSDGLGAGIMSDCGQAAEQTAPPALHTGTLFRLTHPSLKAVTSTCLRAVCYRLPG